MADDDFRPHLMITEADVEFIENKRQGFGKDLGLDPNEHGTKLSSDLDKIVSTYTRVQGVDSLSDADIQIFEVVLHEGEKFSNKSLREFLENEGMSIAAIKEPGRAVVTSTKKKFEDLQRRVGNYRDGMKVNKKFQFVDSFRFPNPEEKQAPSVRELIGKAEGYPLDVELIEHMLSDKLNEQEQMRAEKKLMSVIKKNQGNIQSVPYKLSDGTRVLRAEIPLGKLISVSNDSLVNRIVPTGFFGISPSYAIEAQNEVHLNPNVAVDNLPIVAVLDTGVDFPPELEALVVEHWLPQGSEPGDKRHGTSVASKVAFKNPGEQLSSGILTPRARIIDCNILGADPDNKREGHLG